MSDWVLSGFEIRSGRIWNFKVITYWPFSILALINQADIFFGFYGRHFTEFKILLRKWNPKVLNNGRHFAELIFFLKKMKAKSAEYYHHIAEKC